MRQAKSDARPRALGWSIAVGCAAGLSLTGCMNNPTRGLSASLSKDAAQAALAAEEKSTREKKDTALAKQAPAADSPAVEKAAEEVKLAGAETHAKDSTTKVVQAQQKKIVDDPFAELAAAVDSVDKPVTPAKGKPVVVKEQKAPAVAAAKPNADKESEFDVDAWLSRELPPSRNPLAEIAKQPLSEAAPTKAEKPVAAKAAPFPQPAAGDVESSRGNPFAELESKPAAPVKAPFEDWAIAQQAAPANARPAEKKEPASQLSPRAPVAASGWDQPAAAVQKPVHPLAQVDQADAEQARLRVKALLSDAHSQEIRGELKSAYRSAIIAARLANEQQLSFAAGQEHPRDYAQQLAARIYQLEQPVANAAAPRAPAETDEFVQAQPQPRPFNLQRIEESPAPANLQPAARPDPAPLPNIRPAARMDKIGVWLSKPEIEIAATAPEVPDSAWDARPVAPAIPAPASNVVNADNQYGRIDVQGGVEFAIAHTVTNLDAGISPRDSNSSLQFEPMFPAPQSRVASVPQDLQRQPLLVPPTTLGGTHAQSRADVAWEDVAQPGLVSPVDRAAAVPGGAGKNGRWMWGLAGLLAAAGSVVMGLRMTREEDVESTAQSVVAESVPSEVAPSKESTVRPLKIKRAA